MATRAIREATSKVLTVMQQMLAGAPKQVPADVLEMWAGVLEGAGMTAEDIEAAARIVVSREKFWPTPSVFIEAWRPKVSDDLQAEAAWQRVRDCLSRFGGYASLTVEDVGGDGHALWALDRCGWERLGAEMDEDSRAIYRAEFIRVYRLAVNDRQRLDYLIGRCERENGAAGMDLDPVLCGRPDWRGLPRRQRALPAAGGGGDLRPAGELIRRIEQEAR